MQKPTLDITSEQTLEAQIMVEIAVLTEQLKTLTKHIDELKADIKEIKDIQTQKVSELEKKVSLLEERVARLNWLVNLISTIIITAIVGGLLAIIIK